MNKAKHFRQVRAAWKGCIVCSRLLSIRTWIRTETSETAKPMLYPLHQITEYTTGWLGIHNDVHAADSRFTYTTILTCNAFCSANTLLVHFTSHLLLHYCKPDDYVTHAAGSATVMCLIAYDVGYQSVGELASVKKKEWLCLALRPQSLSLSQIQASCERQSCVWHCQGDEQPASFFADPFLKGSRIFLTCIA